MWPQQTPHQQLSITTMPHGGEWALAQADAIDPLSDGSIPFSRLPPIEQWNWRGW